MVQLENSAAIEPQEDDNEDRDGQGVEQARGSGCKGMEQRTSDAN